MLLARLIALHDVTRARRLPAAHTERLEALHAEARAMAETLPRPE